MSQFNNPPSLEIKPTFAWMIQRLSRTIAFGFGSGLSPIAPGTAGTLWAWAAFVIATNFLSTHNLLWMIAVGILLGCWVCGQVSEELGKRDYGGIVWDEIMAFWLVLIFIAPSNFWMQLIAFALFRFFDAAKPGPIGLIDRYFKQAGNDDAPSTPLQMFWRGFGIMVDDLAAAFFTVSCIALFQFLV
jgi:phosphatidylglycerophosphatase A